MFVVEFRIQKNDDLPHMKTKTASICVGLHVREFKIAPAKRRSFCKEFKLKVTDRYFENEKKSVKLPTTFRLIGNK